MLRDQRFEQPQNEWYTEELFAHPNITPLGPSLILEVLLPGIRSPFYLSKLSKSTASHLAHILTWLSRKPMSRHPIIAPTHKILRQPNLKIT
jgi:hypothetical protein